MEQKVTVERYLQQGIEFVKQGMLHHALALFEKILNVHPEDPQVLFNIAVVLDQLGQRENALSLLHRSMDADPAFANPHYYMGRLYLQARRYSEAYCAFRDAIARDVEFVPAYEGIRIASSAMGQFAMMDKADIVFYTGGHPFHGRTIEEKGLGGSESALIYIARSLAANGKRVHVFCNCDQPGEYDGVRYGNLVDFHIYRKQYSLPVMISSRSLRPFKVAMQSQVRILWIHDAVNVPFLEGEDPAHIPMDCIFAISHWQRDEWSRHFGVPIERFFITRNGVDLTMFRPAEKRSRRRLIYVSRPDRGLDVLLELFPYIRQRVPGAELHIYSYQLPGDSMDECICRKTQQPGVYMHGSLPKAGLAAEMALARLMVYPCIWPETSCIAAIEAQASGTPVVTSTLAALSETVHDGVSGYLIPGNPHTAEFGRRFIEVVVTLMNDDDMWQRLSLGARYRSELLHDWTVIAKEWMAELKRLTDTKKRGL
ncbi:MAG: glycosyltransferase family 41 protein [Candidatus Brocadia sp.]|nr:glycosyltransferase family 41 protein [Candidatus Brocadia sp.]